MTKSIYFSQSYKVGLLFCHHSDQKKKRYSIEEKNSTPVFTTSPHPDQLPSRDVRGPLVKDKKQVF